MAQILKRRTSGEKAAKDVASIRLETTDPPFAKAYPALAEFLSLEEWEAGVERERGTITLFWEDGLFKASINNRDSQEVAFVTKGTHKTLLEAIEKGLATDSLDWRQSGFKGKGSKKRN